MKTLLVANSGGHVSELVSLRDRIADITDELWVTDDSPQTRKLIGDRPTAWVPLIESRDFAGVARAIPAAIACLRSGRYDRVISTGAAIALAYLPIAAAMGISAHYIESTARVVRPSVTGRVLAKVPGITTWWQYDSPPDGWLKVDGPFSRFGRVDEPTPVTVRRIVVTVGTTPYSFHRLIDRLVEIIPDDVEVFWQVGATDTSRHPIEAYPLVDQATLKAAIADADVVISHAGAGSLLECLAVGHIPVLAPRLGSLGEQNDDHQLELASWAHDRRLAETVDAATISWSDIERAAQAHCDANPPSIIELDT